MKISFPAVLSFALGFSIVTFVDSADEKLGELRRTQEHSHVRQGTNPGGARIKHAPRVQDAGSPRTKHDDKLQKLPCTLVHYETEFVDGHHVGSWLCELQGYDAEMAGGEPGSTVLAHIDGEEHIWNSDRTIVSHLTTLHAVGARIEDNHIIISDKDDLLFGEVPHRQRRLVRTTGDLKTLVVRVTSNDGNVEPTAAQIGSSIFGTNGVSLYSVAKSCSWNKVNIIPASGADIVDGVLEMSLNVNIKGGDYLKFCGMIKNQVKAKYSISDLASKFDLVNVVLPMGSLDGTDADWVGFSDFGGNDVCYNDYNIRLPDLAMHETGHSWSLGHAGEGGNRYGDDSGAMGSASLGEYDLGKVCYNGAHSWELGWYSDKVIEVNPLVNSFDGELAGVGKYPGIQDEEYVVLKLTASSVGDYYIMFNHKIGANADTSEAPNKVTVVTMKLYTISTLVGKLGAGEKYTVPNFEGTDDTVTIEVVSIDSSASGFAHVKVYKGDGGTTTSTIQVSSSSCVDNPVWADNAGDKCNVHKEDWCGEGANQYANLGITANTACCVCKDSCVDDAAWRDNEGDGCSEYKADWCGDDAVQYATAGINANMACCICKK